LVHLLISAMPGSVVSLEVLEDVAREDPDGEVLAVQTKSGLDSNPVADRAVGLWKTFANWIDAVRGGELIPANTRFEIYVAKMRRGGICRRFSDASCETHVDDAFQFACDTLFGKSARSKKMDAIAQEIRPHVEKVFDPANRTILKSIILCFTLTSGSGHAYDDLLAEFKRLLIDEDIAEDVLLRGLGWTKAVVDGAIECGAPPIIKVDDFRRELNTFRNKLKSRAYLPSFAGAPTPEEISENRLSVYVRQLNLINWTEEQVFKAISDFLSAKANIVAYAERGYVDRKSFGEFEAALLVSWNNLRRLLDLDEEPDELKRGRRLALRCLAERRRLEGIEVPDDFTPGCFHMLADKPEIGWHPRYTDLLNEDH
jgi:hypothetical protein